MANERELQALVEFLSDDPPVLSLYLNVDSTQKARDEYRLSLRNMLKQAGRKASVDDIRAVEHYFDFEYPGAAKGVIAFSCHEKGLWQSFSLAVPVEDLIVVASRPYVTPLQEILEAYASYGVVLVDKGGAKLLLFHLGELQTAEGTLGDELKRHRQGGRGSARLQKRFDEQALQNFREAVDFTKVFFERHPCDRLILAGTDDNVAAFRGMLPKNLQEKVIGEMPMDMYSSDAQIRDRTLELIRRHVHQEEQVLVDQMITSAAKGEAGVAGLSNTLLVLQEERVHTLLVSEGFERQGARCTHCGYLTADWLDQCPYCRSAMQPYDHVVDAAVRFAIEHSMSVKVISDSAPLQIAGQIGAILRY